MSYYVVTVDGAYKDSHKGKIKRARMTMLLVADTGDAAMDKGEIDAEHFAKLGPKWISFESVGASPVQLPYLLSTTV